MLKAEQPREAKCRTVQLSGGRSWWMHFEFTRINIELTILPKKIEDLRQLGAFHSYCVGKGRE